MLAVGNIKTDEELDQFIAVTTDLVDHYLDNIDTNALDSHRNIKPLLNKYCQNQKLNPHLHRSILAMGISEEDKEELTVIGDTPESSTNFLIFGALSRKYLINFSSGFPRSWPNK